MITDWQLVGVGTVVGHTHDNGKTGGSNKGAYRRNKKTERTRHCTHEAVTCRHTVGTAGDQDRMLP